VHGVATLSAAPGHRVARGRPAPLFSPAALPSVAVVHTAVGEAQPRAPGSDRGRPGRGTHHRRRPAVARSDFRGISRTEVSPILSAAAGCGLSRAAEATTPVPRAGSVPEAHQGRAAARRGNRARRPGSDRAVAWGPLDSEELAACAA